MKKVFYSRIDWWILAVLLVAFVVPMVSACLQGGFNLPVFLVSLLVLSLFHTVYVVKDNRLWVWVGFIPMANKEIGQVKSVLRTSSLWSAPALSIDRLRLTFANGSTLVISPKDRAGFIAALLAINNQIITDENVDDIKQHSGLENEVTAESPAPTGSKRAANVLWVICVLVFLGQVGYAFSVYDTLPDRIATHFDMQGVPNGWMSRFWGIWGDIFVGAGLSLLMWALPHIPGLTINGTENADEATRRKAKDQLSLMLAITALFTLLVFFFVELYIVSKN